MVCSRREASPQTNVVYGFAFLRANKTTDNRGPVHGATAAHGQAGMDRGNGSHYEMTSASVVASPMKVEY